MNLARLWRGLVSDLDLEQAPGSGTVVKGYRHQQQRGSESHPKCKSQSLSEQQVEFTDSITSGNQTRSLSWAYSTVSSGLNAESGEFQKEFRQVSSTLDVKAGKLDSVQVCSTLSEVDLVPHDAEFSLKAQTRRKSPLGKLAALEFKSTGTKTKLSLDVEPELKNKSKDLGFTLSFDPSQYRQPKLALRTGRAFGSEIGKVKDTHTVELDLKKKGVTFDLKSVQSLDQGDNVYAVHTKSKASLSEIKSLAVKLLVKSSARSAVAMSAGYAMKKSWQSLCLPVELELKLPEDKKMKITYEQCCKGEGPSKCSVQCKNLLPVLGFDDMRLKLEKKKIELRANSRSASVQISLPFNLALPPLIRIHVNL